MRGAVRDFSLTLPDDDCTEMQAKFVLPIGLQYAFKTDALQCKKVIEAKLDLYGLLECAGELFKKFGRQKLDLNEHRLELQGKDHQSRMIFRNGPRPTTIAQPNSLDLILDQIKNEVQSVLIPINDKGDLLTSLTSGVNMASVISMPTLCYTCAAAAKETEVRTNGVVSVFGDDVAAVLPPDVKDPGGEVDRPRLEFGLKPKASATGVQTRPDSLTVFTERFLDGNGVQHHGPKPGSLVRLFLASHPGKYIGKEEDSEDFEGVCHAITTHHPSIVSSNHLNVTLTHMKKRVTQSRSMAADLIRSIAPDGSNPIGERRSNGLIGEVEERLLCLLPSTRGKPERVKRNPQRSRINFSEEQFNRVRRILDSES
jgi:hypothetical protein